MEKLTTKKMMIYYIYFQVEQVVEECWLRPEEEYIQEFDEMEDTLSQEFGDRREKDRDLKKMRGQIENDTYKQVDKQRKLWKRERAGN
jgi:phage regulator Rha-like protein